MTTQELWHAVLGELELAISQANFKTWFGQTHLQSFDKGAITISVPNGVAKSWLENKYQKQIIHSIERILGQPVQKITFRIESASHPMPQLSAPTPVAATNPAPSNAQSMNHSGMTSAPQPNRAVNSSFPTQTTVTERIEAKNKFGLNPRYTFESFIVGKTNELAHAAAQAVANRPGEVYNPLFIYGGVGLGKTHLIQAIGNRISANDPQIKILYISSERFTNEFVAAIRSGSIKQFKETYRNIDLLLIDDIQFIAGKTETQEEFFHTFNELHQANKQIVMTSDRPPKAIPGLEDRLRSRFEWGMIADVASPDLETRVAILESKCIEKKCTLNKELLQVVATLVKSNIRELEGALNKILAQHQLRGEAPTVESVKILLSGYEEQSYRKSLTPKELTSVVSQYFDVSIDELMSANREKRLAFPRQIIMYLLREELKCSFPSIGQEMGGRDHTTAMHAYEKISRESENDMKLKQDIAAIRQRLYTITQG
ncbi:MAG: chromosomal replication initiator protein DnaA [Candidatus Magasanikbacteria bacterium]|nr:chromosomal replication initiator protein DnaA [Candidatus Magasanikbacteria bacterium]